MEGYDHKKIEKKWGDKWAKSSVYKAKESVKGKDNFYLLVEFPYPSGNLHVGHWYAFAVPDILARYQRMRGRNVLFPIGFDAFGLPAENAAIKNKLDPKKWTESNMAYMRKQMRSMGASFDWSREVATCDPEYYKWTQWQFLQFFKKGLVYRKETAVNWCPKDKTVLANEQVVDGKCERCEAGVEQKSMLQWNIKITEYADRLIDDLKDLDWPEQIKESQRNWIGRSEGAEIDFALSFDSNDHPRNFVLLHGRGASSKSGFWPWLREQLERRGHRVQMPDLPNPESPNDEEQADFVQKHCTFGDNSVIIGHSFGGVVAMRLLERGVQVERLTLLGTPYSGIYLDSHERPTVSTALKKGFDGKKIRAAARSIVLVYDTEDKVIPVSDGEALSALVDGSLFKEKAESSHFGASIEPRVLQYADPTITVFTTRPDTLFGATYLVLAPEHPWVTLALEHQKVFLNNEDVQKYVDAAKKKSELERMADQKEKTGVMLEGVWATNPATKEKIPLYVADYVLATYGTGAIMAVPAHDERDHEFAKKFDLPVTTVIEPVFSQTTDPGKVVDGLPFEDRDSIIAIVKHSTEDKYLALKWKQVAWGTFVTGGVEPGQTPEEAARAEILQETGYKDLTLLRNLGKLHGKFYHVPKKVNRFAHSPTLLFQLMSERQVPISKEEQDKHEVVWLTLQELQRFLTPDSHKRALEILNGVEVYTGTGMLTASGEFNALTSDEAKVKMADKFGRRKTTYKLRDWIVSRQRYWGVPIPIIHCPKCGPVSVPDKDLPVKLPAVKDYLPEGTGKSPLAKAKVWAKVKCPQCKGAAERETDTLDTFVDSSWYFLRYTDPKNKKAFADAAKMAAWMPVKLYSGGAEHTTMHVLYSRFWHKALFDLGLVADKEPYARRMNRSLIMGPDGQKMSKSRGNVIDPDEVVKRLGADTVRMYLAFIGPYNEVSSYPWNPDGVVGVRRFLERVFKAQDIVMKEDVGELQGPLHRTIKKVGDDIDVLKFNTAIAALMTFLNEVEKKKSIGRRQWEIFLMLLQPFAPFLAEELWCKSGHKTSLTNEVWPQFDESLLRERDVVIAVQVNGKTRAQVSVPTDAPKDQVIELARQPIASRIMGHKVDKTIHVPNRLVNFVIHD